MSSAVTARLMPSFGLPSGVRCWRTVIAVTIVGAVAMPAISRAVASASSEPDAWAAASGRGISTAMADRHHGSRRAADVPGSGDAAAPLPVPSVPNSSPAAQEPAACSLAGASC